MDHIKTLQQNNLTDFHIKQIFCLVWNSKMAEPLTEILYDLGVKW